jgi:EmrB/QacA subfamily drug resistance transporter
LDVRGRLVDRDRIYERRWWTLGVLSLSLVIIGLDNTILNVAIPTLQKHFDATASSLQWMVDAYVLVFAGLLLTMGAIGDRFGRYRALAAGLVVFGVASASAAFSGSEGQLIASRAIMGIGGALIMPATLSIVTDVFPGDERGRAIAIWSAVAGLGIGIGPLLGGFLLEHFWWGSVFLVNVPIVIAALALGLFFVPDSKDPEAAALDPAGAVLSMGAVSALVYAIIEAPSKGWGDRYVIAGFVGAVVLGALFVVWERRAPAPMLPLELFSRPRFSMGSGAISISFFALFGSVFLLTQYLQFVLGYTALEAGVRTAPISLGVAIGASRSHFFVRRFGTKRVVAAGMLFLGLALVAVSTWDTTTSYWVIGGTLVVMTFFMGNVMAPATDSVMGAVPAAKAGVGSAMNDVTRQVGGALGVAIIGSVLNAGYADRMASVVASLPPQAAGPAGDSVGAAVQIAAKLPAGAGDALAAAARQAFVDSMGSAFLVGAAIALVGVVLVLRFLPAREQPHAVAGIEPRPAEAGA